MALLESRLIITGEDRAGSAFASVEAQIAELAKRTSSVGAAASEISKVSASVDAVSGSMARAQGMVEGLSAKMHAMSAASGVGGVAASVSAASRQMMADGDRLLKAMARLEEYKRLEGSVVASDINFGKTHAALEQLTAEMAATAAPSKEMQRDLERVTRNTREAAQTLIEQQRALAEARVGFEELAGPLDGVAEAEARLRAQVESLSSAFIEQGRAAQQSAEAQSRAAKEAEALAMRQQHRRATVGHLVGELLPFEGPEILHLTKEASLLGATVQERIAQLQTSGAKQEEIDKASADYREFSKTHAGTLEADYLASYKDARVIAPGEESFEMAQLGARYRVALRNSGLSAGENDTGNVLRIMDELGLKSMPEREDFLNNFLKSQQAFGDQIKTETALAAYRNAKQSIYGWSPEFRNKVFPTLLQSSGQQGGTEMMTALNNYIGGHMQTSEFKALIGAGFVDNKDLSYEHNKPVLRPGAHLFEADVFKSNIGQWAWDFHDTFMKRKGSSEDKFDDLIAKMPRNMAGLIAFFTHNEARIKRDMGTLDKPVGLGAEGDAALANNPIAGLSALKDSIEQFAAAVTAPAMKPIGNTLSSIAQGITDIANAVAAWDKAHPAAAKAIGLGAIAGGVGLGGFLTAKLFSNISGFFRGGPGAAAGEIVPEAIGEAGGLSRFLPKAGLSQLLPKAGEGLLTGLLRRAAWTLGYADPVGWYFNMMTPAGGEDEEGHSEKDILAAVPRGAKPRPGVVPPRPDLSFYQTQLQDIDAQIAAIRARLPWDRPAAIVEALDPLYARRREAQANINELGGKHDEIVQQRRLEGAGWGPMPERGAQQVMLDPNSKATVEVTIRVDAGSDLLKAIVSASAASAGNIQANVGVTKSPAAAHLGHQ